MFPFKEGQLIAIQAVDVQDKWVGDLHITQKFCTCLTEGAPLDSQLERQVQGFWTLIKVYGPNQLVLVNPQGNHQVQGY